MISPRFFGDDVLDSCLSGRRISSGSGDPPETIARLQQSLKDLGFKVEVNGAFDAVTEDAVAAYKNNKRILPADPVVDPETMTTLDADFAYELFDAKASELASTAFNLGKRVGEREELEDGASVCKFQNGVVLELGHLVVYALMASAEAAWTTAGGLAGEFGPPISDPMQLLGGQSVQEFLLVAFFFSRTQEFTLPLEVWHASVAGGEQIGEPISVPQGVGQAGATFVPHTAGVVLSMPEAAPQPLPQAVFDLWKSQEEAGSSLGGPTGFAFPSTEGPTVFPFLSGSISMDEAGVPSLVGRLAPDLQRYFQPEDAVQFRLRPMVQTTAIPFIGGEAAFKAMRDTIAGAGGSDDFVYILSWHCNVDLPLVAGDASSTLRALLADCANRGAQIRAMLWAGDPIPSPPAIVAIIPALLGVPLSVPWQLAKDYARTKTSRPINTLAVDFINALQASGRDGAAILDDRHLPAGSHHQKVVIVRAGGKLFGFIGGIEANADRLPPALAGEPGSPLFDISVRLEDTGAWLLLQTFLLRWAKHPNQLGSALRGDNLSVPSHAGPLTVQVTHTYGRGFPFPNVAVQTASVAIANGIRNARMFFYMEDQYFVGSPEMRAAMRDALAAGAVGILVIAAEFSVVDLPDIPFRRRDFLGPLVSAFPGQLLIFERLGGGSPTGPTAYVHSKLLIVDDEVAFLGSVNSNRRSWFHDSEVDATIVDSRGAGGVAPGSRGWVRDFRCNLWALHLGIATSQLGDFAICLTVWQAVISGQLVMLDGSLVDISGTKSVRAYDVTATVPRYSVGGVSLPSSVLDYAWNSLCDPR